MGDALAAGLVEDDGEVHAGGWSRLGEPRVSIAAGFPAGGRVGAIREETRVLGSGQQAASVR